MYNYKELPKLFKNDVAMLVGALLLKLSLIYSSGLPLVDLVDPNEKDDENDDKKNEPKGLFNRSFPLATQHTISGCISNVETPPMEISLSSALSNQSKQELVINESMMPMAVALWNERDSILMEWKENCHKPSHPDVRILFRAMDLVTVACEIMRMPSGIIIAATILLMKVSRAFYDPSEVYTYVRDMRQKDLEKIANIPGMMRKLFED
ncbi:hypothetical protein QAD02_011352 [Eretmocerus hayati]|uniref:Uncharacterized protein n=1 Tax=Eretmocerus hayati TaxID=131215 RepID=A0ACC2NY89_9HYME|nr:hypothetical protein QAD02_011352 [Eretmocerus hayati]